MLLEPYVKGALRLYEEVEKDSADHTIVYSLYIRLKENVDSTIFGDTSEKRSERIEILSSLNHITERLFGCSFIDYYLSSDNQHILQRKNSDGYKKNSLSMLSSDKIQVKFPASIIPTAYCSQFNTQNFPLIQIAVDNSHSDSSNVSLSITARIEDYSYLAQETVTVAKGMHKELALSPVLKHDKIATLHDIREVTLYYCIKQTLPDVRILQEGTKPLHLMARNRALIAIRDENKNVQDLTKYLAAWVTPNRPEIAIVQREAIRYRPQAFVGYQGGTAESVREQAFAIFSALKYKGLAYANSALNWEIQPGYITQKVRLPRECLEEGMCANCLDGAVLFASLLDLSGIAPLLVLVPGHAFVGWHIEPGGKEYEFLETTMISTDDFEPAQDNARLLYEKALAEGDFERTLFHKDGFARLIDIVQNKQEGIYPLE